MSKLSTELVLSTLNQIMAISSDELSSMRSALEAAGGEMDFGVFATRFPGKGKKLLQAQPCFKIVPMPNSTQLSIKLAVSTRPCERASTELVVYIPPEQTPSSAVPRPSFPAP